jgi:hypothetical protein
MISLAVATRYDRVAEAGRNRPLRVVVEADEGVEYEVFLKSSGCPELTVTSLAHEVLAACIAGQVGLPVCRPFLVELTPEWVASVHDAEVRQILQASNPIAFGSTAAGPGWKQWSSDDVLTPARREKALGIFVFDAFIENPDRKPSNPNLLVKGDEFRIIDHELALLVRGLLPRPAPWRPGYLNHMMGPDSHVFASRLRGGALDLDPIRTAWSNVSDDDLSDYEASLPEQWAEAGDAVTAALTHIRAVRDRIDECLVEIRRTLA